jgi:glutamate synthase domain-containing protein 3
MAATSGEVVARGNIGDRIQMRTRGNIGDRQGSQ